MKLEPEKKKKGTHLGLEAKPLQALSLSSLSSSRNTRSAPEKAFEEALLDGLKMASVDQSVFHDRLVNPLLLVRALKALGTDLLTWTPETLFSFLDEKYSGWTKDQSVAAMKHFHETGTLKSDIPQLVREKIYAIRVISKTDLAQNDWNVFEKVGGALNDRTAKFGVVEPLSPAECARTIAVIESVRPDQYSDEVKIYIAACCHEAGLLTAKPVKWLAMCEPYLERMNQDRLEEPVGKDLLSKISVKYSELLKQRSSEEIPSEEETVISVQAAKLAAITLYSEDLFTGT